MNLGILVDQLRRFFHPGTGDAGAVWPPLSGPEPSNEAHESAAGGETSVDEQAGDSFLGYVD